MRRRPELKLGLQVVARCLVTIVVLLALYYLLPVRGDRLAVEVIWVVVELALFAAVVAFEVLRILKAHHPALRAVQAMAVIVPLFLVIFARIYLQISMRSPGSFSMHLDSTRALYFTITTFATVGYGDITPTTDSVRLLVSAQMLLDLVVVGIVAKLLIGAAQRGVASKLGERDPGQAPLP